MSNNKFDRRGLLGGAAVGLAGLLGGCDQIPRQKLGRDIVFSAEDLTYRVQRFLLRSDDLAREYGEADITPHFRPNGTYDPTDADYRALARDHFVDWRLTVDGLVDHPLELSLAELRAMPARTQITRHDCVEGWSCIGKWTGVPLSEVLGRAGVKPQAKYVMFYCADSMNGLADPALDTPAGGAGTPAQRSAAAANPSGRYYESIDLRDAVHPQTILAYEMNGKDLPIAYGAPLRLRVERQLGYKMAKYLMRLLLVDDFRRIGGGNGGYWEDLGYEWFAGI